MIKLCATCKWMETSGIVPTGTICKMIQGLHPNREVRNYWCEENAPAKCPAYISK